MRFIEMTGKTLATIIDETEIEGGSLERAGVEDTTIVRVNELGDIEVRRHHKWDLIGGLLGEFEARVRQQTGMDWV